MKKISSLLCAMLAFGGLTAQADVIDVVLNVDDASHVTVATTDSTYSLVNGENTIQVEQWNTLMVTPVSPWSLDKVHNNTRNEDVEIYSGKCYLSPSADDGASFTITTYNPDDFRTAIATFNIDDASLVQVMRINDSQYYELQSVTDTIKFDPVRENKVMIGPKDYDKPIYSVKLNGEPVQDNYGSYELTLTDSCTVDITAIVPDVDVTVTFTFADEVSKGCITEVSVNDESKNFNEPITMKAGQTIFIEGNEDYKVDEFTVNGKAMTWYGSIDLTVMTDTKIAFKAHPYGKIKATINVEDASTILVGTGYSVNNDNRITLNSGATEIELPENNAMICWQAAYGCLVDSVYIDGVKQPEYMTSATLKDRSVVTFYTSKIELDKTAVIWIDKKELGGEYFTIQAYDRSMIEIENGYNEVPFYDGMLPISLSWYTTTALPASEVYVNNQLKAPQYEGSFTYYFDPLEDGSVIKIFFAAKPVKCAVTFDVAEGVQVTAKADRITEIAELSDSLFVFAGTEIALAGAEDSELLVKVNDTEITPAEDGTYTLTVNDPKTTISVAAKPQDSIDEITVRTNSADAIYDLQGRRVAKAGKGIYIINGKQTLLR